MTEEEKDKQVAEWQAKAREDQKAKGREATSSGGAAASSGGEVANPGGATTRSKEQTQSSRTTEPLIEAASCKSAEDWNQRMKQQESLK